MTKLKKRLRKIYRNLGPGFITGIADDDPSGIGTYAQTGAQFGYALLWCALYLLPLQTAIQEACARIGAVTGKGLTKLIKEHYSKYLVYLVVSLVLSANIINIGADIAAMAESAALILPLNPSIYAIAFTAIIVVLEIRIPYEKYANILKWLCLSLLAYPITVFIVKQPWGTLFKSTFIPHFEMNFSFLFILTGVFGTTISPYLFFWEASEEVEEKRLRKKAKTERPNKHFIHRMQIDNFLGMFISQIGTWSIIVVAGTILHAHNITDIQTAAEAARALEPLVQTFPNSGYIAKCIFAVGVIGLGLLSIPVLAGSAAYACSEAFNWREGLNLKFKTASGFYTVIIISTALGLLFTFMHISPIKALVFAAVINGIAAVPLIFLITRIAGNRNIMKGLQSGFLSKLLLNLTFLIMGLCVLATFVSFFFN